MTNRFLWPSLRARVIYFLLVTPRYLRPDSGPLVAVLFVGGEQPILDEKTPVAESVLSLRLIVREVRRHTHDDLDLLERNQLQALTVAVVPVGRAVGLPLPDDVVPELLFEAWRRRRQRCEPVRLFGSRLLRPLEPIITAGATFCSTGVRLDRRAAGLGVPLNTLEL